VANPTDLASVDSAGDAEANETVIKDFAEMISTMSRLISRIEGMALFSESDIGLPEWVALSISGDLDGISSKELARRLGVTPQRAQQLSGSLLKAQLFSIAQSTEDSKKKVIKVTPAGKAKWEAINSELEPLLTEALGKKVRTLASANKQMRTIVRALPARKPIAEKDASATPR